MVLLWEQALKSGLMDRRGIAHFIGQEQATVAINIQVAMSRRKWTT